MLRDLTARFDEMRKLRHQLAQRDQTRTTLAADWAEASGGAGPSTRYTTALLGIEGMRCASCVARVEQELQAVPGVVAASVSLPSEEAWVAFTPAAADVAELEQAVGPYRPWSTAVHDGGNEAGALADLTDFLDHHLKAVRFLIVPALRASTRNVA